MRDNGRGLLFFTELWGIDVMGKLRTFGALRMLYMTEGRDIAKMRAYLEKYYTKTEQERIRAAFKTIGTDQEVAGGKVLVDNE